MIANSTHVGLKMIFLYIDALEAMTRVADYINEVQRLCETYGTVLDSFLRDQTLPEVRLPYEEY